jgi:hypothetical protein
MSDSHTGESAERSMEEEETLVTWRRSWGGCWKLDIIRLEGIGRGVP